MRDPIIDTYRVEPGIRVRLSDFKTDASGDLSKKYAEKELKRLRRRLIDLHYLLSAGHEHKLLVVLQGMDTAGKDSTIRHVFELTNPQIVKVSSFKVPSTLERDHDYLWRVHSKVPGKGEITIFNRSHYEDVLAVRVHNLVPEDAWQKRFGHIKDFERMLSDEGVRILKFFLHISEDEQKKRLKERLQDPVKLWKFNVNDVKERGLWPKYMEAYEDVLSRTSTVGAPWFIVPADVKWGRDLIVTAAIVDALERLHMKYPKPQLNAKQIKKMLKKL